MKAIVHFARSLAIIFLALSAIAGVIFPFTALAGFRGYMKVLLMLSGTVCALGAIFVCAGQGSRRSITGLEASGIPEDVLHEMRKDEQRGSSLGLELFYAGLACLALAYLIFRSLE